MRDTYAEIARDGGGEMAGVKWDQKLTEQVLVFAFGSRWREQVLAAGGGRVIGAHLSRGRKELRSE